MATFYHVSWHYKNIIETFTPRIPKSALPIEDVTIPRIPLCKEIKDCLNAIGYMSNYLYMDSYKELDTEYVPVRVYEFELNKKEILSSKDIVEYVPDALRTKEVWSIKEIKPRKSYIILPTYFFQEDNYPFDIFDFEYEDEKSIEELEINIGI
jgi:hypothetical protein